MKHVAIIGSSILLFAIGIALGYYLDAYTKVQKDSEWIGLSIEPNQKIGFTTAAFLKSDISLPKIINLSGKLKFLNPLSTEDTRVPVGYIVVVNVDNLDLENVPEKYKNENELEYEGHKIIREPIKEVVYEVSFEFTLIDKDGFELITLESPKHYLVSGKENRFQSKIKQNVYSSLADQAENIVLFMTIENCETCK